MDLTKDQVSELFGRANAAWETSKAGNPVGIEAMMKTGCIGVAADPMHGWVARSFGDATQYNGATPGAAVERCWNASQGASAGEEAASAADPAVKYFIGTLHERNGEREYQHKVRFMTNGDPHVYLDDVASRCYNEEGGDEEGDGYWFDGVIFVRAGVCREITKEFYIECHQTGAVTNA